MSPDGFSSYSLKITPSDRAARDIQHQPMNFLGYEAQAGSHFQSITTCTLVLSATWKFLLVLLCACCRMQHLEKTL
jgi:hypothetical protein